jgi:hypothetical protein
MNRRDFPRGRIMKQVVAAGLLFIALSGCQQNAGNVAGNTATNTSTATNTTNASASATPPAAPDPATQTGPVALASDASLPAPCQTVVRETQACIDNLSGNQAAFREEWLRSMLASSRSTWASAYDDSYRGPVCEQDLRTLRQRVAGFDCAAR